MKIKIQSLSKLVKRNERERKRVMILKNGYETLKKHIPEYIQTKNMSKRAIVMNAIKYIKLLQSAINEDMEKNQNYLEQSNQYNNIIEHNLNQNQSQSFNQQINSLDYYTNGNV